MSRHGPATAVGAIGVATLSLALSACRQQPVAPGVPQVGPAVPTPEPTRVYLFFPGDDTLLHREIREVPEVPAATSSRVAAVLEELLGGPHSGLAPAFPWAATVETVFVDGAGNAYVDFSAPPADAVHGSSTEAMLVYSVVNTVVANCPGVERVQVLFGGREVETLGHLDLSRPLPAQPQLVFSP